MNATNILERNIARQSNVPDRRSSGSGQIPLNEVDSPIYYGSPAAVDADIVIPIYNEEVQLADSVSTLCSFLDRHARDLTRFSWNVVIADNASTDASWQIAKALCDWCPNQVRALHLVRKGRGYALKQAWLSSMAAVAHIWMWIYPPISALRAALFSPCSRAGPTSPLARVLCHSLRSLAPPNVNSFHAPTTSCSAHIWLSPFMMPSAVSRPLLPRLHMSCCLR